jgi:hypothetical protein
MRLYKYLSSRYAEPLLEGAVRFQALAYYRRHEAAGSIGDVNEAARVFRPPHGLEVSNLTTGKRFRLQATFRSSADTEKVFVFCVSRVLNTELARDFGCDVCVEIADADAFAERLKRAIEGPEHYRSFVHGPVSYYGLADAPGIDWTLPKTMVFAKLTSFARQQEYRFAFGHAGAFDMARTTQELCYR